MIDAIHFTSGHSVGSTVGMWNLAPSGSLVDSVEDYSKVTGVVVVLLGGAVSPYAAGCIFEVLISEVVSGLCIDALTY